MVKCLPRNIDTCKLLRCDGSIYEIVLPFYGLMVLRIFVCLNVDLLVILLFYYNNVVTIIYHIFPKCYAEIIRTRVGHNYPVLSKVFSCNFIFVTQSFMYYQSFRLFLYIFKLVNMLEHSDFWYRWKQPIFMLPVLMFSPFSLTSLSDCFACWEYHLNLDTKSMQTT